MATPEATARTARRRRLVWLLAVVNTLAVAHLVWQSQRLARLNRPPDGLAVVRVTDVQVRGPHTVALTYEADLDALEAIEANECHFLAATSRAHFRRGEPSTLPGPARREAVWHLPPPLNPNDAGNVAEQLRAHWMGRKITLSDARFKLLFGVTNHLGDRYQGFLRLTVANPPAAPFPDDRVVLSAPSRGLRVTPGGRKVFGLQVTAGAESLLTCEFILRRGGRSVCLSSLSAQVVTPKDGAFHGGLMWSVPLATDTAPAVWELRTVDEASQLDAQAGWLAMPDLAGFDWRHGEPLAPEQLPAGGMRELPLFRAATETGPEVEVLARVRRWPLPEALRRQLPHGGILKGLPAAPAVPTAHPPAPRQRPAPAPLPGRNMVAA